MRHHPPVIRPELELPLEATRPDTTPFRWEAWIAEAGGVAHASGTVHIPSPATAEAVAAARARVRHHLRQEWDGAQLIVAIPDWHPARERNRQP